MADVERTQSLIDLAEVARRLAVNERHVRRLVAERRIPFVKWGHLLRFDPQAIDEWVDDHRRDPRPAA
jgi:excisionase family DNA binding protein